MKSAEKEDSTEERKHGEITVKTEMDQEMDEKEEEYTNGDDLNILIKEEPHSPEICHQHGEDASSCSAANPATRRDGLHLQEHTKQECDSESEYTAVKEEEEEEESDSWIKEEILSENEAEEEAEDSSNIQDELEEEEEEACTGTSCCLSLQFFPK